MGLQYLSSWYSQLRIRAQFCCPNVGVTTSPMQTFRFNYRFPVDLCYICQQHAGASEILWCLTVTTYVQASELSFFARIVDGTWKVTVPKVDTYLVHRQ